MQATLICCCFNQISKIWLFSKFRCTIFQTWDRMCQFAVHHCTWLLTMVQNCTIQCLSPHCYFSSSACLLTMVLTALQCLSPHHGADLHYNACLLMVATLQVANLHYNACLLMVATLQVPVSSPWC